MRSDLELIRLQDQIISSKPELLDRQIREFCCAKDPDVEAFLKEKAVLFERSGISRTYLFVVNDNERSNIVAYFSIAITATNFEGVSKSRKTHVLGATPYRDFLDHFGGLLVAQLARDDSYTPNDINGIELINAAEKTVEQGRFYLGGRVLYLDCRHPLIALYEKSDFKLLRNEPDSLGLYKMFKMLPKL
ncbi:MAG: hypothetical protein LBN36_04685 [Clostridiales Family XIII bacterium]|jgi:hypothetical protein|nr:hypothetical protein [Clostridiales Family XIII bacterium]